MLRFSLPKKKNIMFTLVGAPLPESDAMCSIMIEGLAEASPIYMPGRLLDH